MRFRPEAEIYPLLNEDELKALAADIDHEGQRQSISLYQGDILDGRNRYLAITRYCKPGLEPKFENVEPESPIGFVISLNEKRRHLNDSQRGMAAERARPFFEREAKERQGQRADLAPTSAPIGAEVKSPHRASEDAALAFGTSPRTVERARTVQTKGSKKLVEAVDQGALSLGKAEQITKLYPDKRAQDAQVKAIAESKMVTRVKGLTGEVEWYTPRLYLDAAIAVMGGIDLDPASSTTAQEHVRARRYFTVEEDGRAQRWSGRVFLNPPYAMPFVRDFVAKLVGAYQAGDIDEGILLTNNATDTEWFHAAARACTALCLTRGRIHFLEARYGELVEKPSPTHGQAFFYFGPKGDVFEEVFSQHGIVLYRDRDSSRARAVEDSKSILVPPKTSSLVVPRAADAVGGVIDRLKASVDSGRRSWSFSDAVKAEWDRLLDDDGNLVAARDFLVWFMAEMRGSEPARLDWQMSMQKVKRWRARALYGVEQAVTRVDGDGMEFWKYVEAVCQQAQARSEGSSR